ncbi:MAG: fimbrillin family protein [Rikenellaceae bacterium]
MKKVLIIASLALIFASCQKDATQDLGRSTLPEDGVMRFTTQVSESRAGLTTSTLTNFGIYTYYDSAYTYENVKVEKNGSEYQSEETMRFEGEDDNITISAYAPYSSTPSSFTVLSNQSTEDGVKASDLLYACSEVTPSNPNNSNDIYYDSENQAINIIFNHILAKTTINITLGTQWSADLVNPITSVTISGTNTTASLDFNSEYPITSISNAASISAMYLDDFALGLNPTLSYEAILIPQQVAKGELKIVITTDNGSFTWYSDKALSLNSDENNILNLEIGTILNY